MLKQPKIRSETHRRFIAHLPCLICGRFDVQAAHLRAGTGGGMGLKPCDSYTLPLCLRHHEAQHQIGEKKFWGRRLDSARALTQKLYDITGNRPEAMALMINWRVNGWKNAQTAPIVHGRSKTGDGSAKNAARRLQ